MTWVVGEGKKNLPETRFHTQVWGLDCPHCYSLPISLNMGVLYIMIKQVIEYINNGMWWIENTSKQYALMKNLEDWKV